MLQPILYVALFLLCALIAKVRSRTIRQAALLIASYALYLTWGLWFTAVLLASTLMNFLLGRWLRRKPTALPLWTGILLNLTLLSTFKYLPAISTLPAFSCLALPLGMSFWTFAAMSYLFDQYRGEELNPTLSEFALYIAFFPVTISGPICRLPDMLPQFRSEEITSWEAIAHGFRRVATGVFMVQLAKLLGRGILAGDGITSGFDRATHWTGPDAWCLALGCGLQLFLDFAGYSHIAIGAAQMLGITVPENFARPFHSATPSIFWTRWHMSLSFWIRDYVFLPLATARREMWWRNFALVVSMVVFGLWHQASVLFLLWGCYHGVLLVLHRQVQQLQRRFDWNPPAHLWTTLSWIATTALINLGWILFRANSILQARQMLAAIVSPQTYASHILSGNLYLLVATIAAGYAVTLLVTDILDRSSANKEATPGLWSFLSRTRGFWLPPLYGLALLFLLIVTLTQGPSTAQFMYRKF